VLTASIQHMVGRAADAGVSSTAELPMSDCGAHPPESAIVRVQFRHRSSVNMSLHRFAGFNGVTLAADVTGRSGQPPVILMHGGGQTRRSWGTAAHALAQRGYRVIALDLRGHGDTDWAPDCDYSLDAFVNDLKAVLDEVGVPAALVGASLGGLVGLLAVGENDAPLASSLVLVDVVPQIDIEGASRIKGFMTGYPDGFASVEEAADAVAAYLPHRPRPKDVSGLRKNLRVGRAGRLYWHWDPNFMADQNIDPLAIRERMSAAALRVRIPTLLVRGEHSEIVSSEGVDEFKALIPHAEYVDVKGARHMVAGDENTVFNQSVVEFLERTVARGAERHTSKE
jgi:pimeloyl-ACP methyl ester carboxylesterase